MDAENPTGARVDPGAVPAERGPSGTGHDTAGWKARRVRLRVYAAKRDPYPEEEWAWGVTEAAPARPEPGVLWAVREQILTEVNAERDRQDTKWGGVPGIDRHDEHTYAAVLGEEFGEACQAWIERDALALRAELVQTAAVAVAWIEEIDNGGCFVPDQPPVAVPGPADDPLTLTKCQSGPASVSPAEPPEIAHKEPEPMDSRERTLHFWLARLVAYPRWVSIGSINSHAELARVSAEDFAKIQEVLRGR